MSRWPYPELQQAGQGAALPDKGENVMLIGMIVLLGVASWLVFADSLQDYGYVLGFHTYPEYEWQDNIRSVNDGE
jgi:hypothetical protein